MHSTLILEFSGEIAKITLNRPDKRNAINTHMIAELQTALDTIEKSHSRVVIVTGAGSAFCAGMDLDMLAAIAPLRNSRPRKIRKTRGALPRCCGGCGVFRAL
jgi:enoyl-CoA hydratase/carnithine racemase